jgi:hypothetical protein
MMKKGLMLPVILVIVISMGLAVPAQADLVGLTILLAAIWTSGVVVNKTIISPNDQQDQRAVQKDVGNSPDLAAQTQSH